MDYKNKIIKYKLKKIKIENKINNLIVNKKKSHQKFIDKTIANIKNLPDIINQIKNSEQKKYIIVTGTYGVGKSTIIKILQNSLQIQNCSWINLNDNNLEENINNIMVTDINLDNNLIFIEINIDILNLLLKKIVNEKIYIINVIPYNVNNYKNKLINKIFIDIKADTNDFFINIQKYYNDLEYLYKNINRIKNFEKNILSDNDFDFIDNIIVKIINYGKLYKIENSTFEILDIEF